MADDGVQIASYNARRVFNEPHPPRTNVCVRYCSRLSLSRQAYSSDEFMFPTVVAGDDDEDVRIMTTIVVGRSAPIHPSNTWAQSQIPCSGFCAGAPARGLGALLALTSSRVLTGMTSSGVPIVTPHSAGWHYTSRQMRPYCPIFANSNGWRLTAMSSSMHTSS